MPVAIILNLISSSNGAFIACKLVVETTIVSTNEVPKYNRKINVRGAEVNISPVNIDNDVAPTDKVFAGINNVPNPVVIKLLSAVELDKEPSVIIQNPPDRIGRIPMYALLCMDSPAIPALIVSEYRFVK